MNTKKSKVCYANKVSIAGMETRCIEMMILMDLIFHHAIDVMNQFIFIQIHKLITCTANGKMFHVYWVIQTWLEVTIINIKGQSICSKLGPFHLNFLYALLSLSNIELETKS